MFTQQAAAILISAEAPSSIAFAKKVDDRVHKGPACRTVEAAALAETAASSRRLRYAFRLPREGCAADALSLSVLLSSNALRGSVNSPSVIAPCWGRLPTMQQYSSERPLGSLK